MNLSRIARKFRAGFDLFTGSSKYSYSQFAEDILVDTVFTQTLGIAQPSYLDIGANKPKAGSNTYFFYLKRCFGVCVEPDVELYKHIKATRPRDVVINAGVGINDQKEARFYYFPEPYTGWNTFSKEDAELKKSQTGVVFKDDRIISFININKLIKDHFGTAPDFISLDVEGLDMDILRTLDFEKHAPKALCVETMEFNNTQLGKKNTEIIAFLENKGYVIYADTYINSIFIKKDLLNV
jgi:FkbM family methyltransferase